MKPSTLILSIFGASLAFPALALTENYVSTPWDYIFYTAAICLIVFSTLIILAYREYKWLPYTGLSALLVLNAAAQDGVLLSLTGGGEFALWVVPFLIFASTASYGYALVALRLEPPHKLADYRQWFWRLSILCILFPLTAFMWLRRIPLDMMWIPVNVLFFGMVIAQILPPLTWQSGTRMQLRFLRAFPLVVAVFSIGMYGSHFVFLELSQAELNTLHRVVLLLFTAFSMTIVVWQAFASARARESAELAALRAERERAETELALAQSDQQYQRAQQAADRNRSQLAQVSHDLKQPIAALRSTLQRLESADHDGSAQNLNRAVEYIDSLAGAYVKEESALEEPEDPGNGEPLPQGHEWVDAQLYSRTLSQMFSTEAAEKNIEFTVKHSAARIYTDPLITMRMVSNLVANALAHAQAGRILAGFRRVDGRLHFQVHDDGVGIASEDLKAFLKEGEKSADSEGQGLGLAIVKALSDQQGADFSIRSVPGRGTSASVDLGPLA